MDKIEVRILNPEVIGNAEKMMVCAARMTQRGHQIKCMDDFMELYEKSYTENTAKAMTRLPYPTIQKFGAINVVIVGASRRFLAQITRHQNEVKFMSGSLQYSDYSNEAAFAIPYGVMKHGTAGSYLATCHQAMEEYESAIASGVDNDSAGFLMPQALRNVLIVSATPYQWKHMIGQRTCRRNTDETRIVMLKVWEALYEVNPRFFAPDTTGPFCMKDSCKEGRMSCGSYISSLTPRQILELDYPLLYEEDAT